jgi:hypothetical protein
MNDMPTSLLDSNLDDLADMPAFENIKPGQHVITILGFEEKKIGEHPAIELRVKLKETLELSTAADTPNEVGTESSIAFMLDNEFGQGQLKEILKPISVATGASGVRAIMEAAKNLECTIVSKLRKDKNDPDKQYFTIKKLTVN